MYNKYSVYDVYTCLMCMNAYLHKEDKLMNKYNDDIVNM